VSEENTTENQAPIDPELSASPELEDGELSEEELDAQSGGFASPDPFGLPQGDMKVPANTDSSYTTGTGALGTRQNEAAMGGQKMNLTMSFP